jgi:raffinose/stachyose/melibiose transport system permease protein
MTGGGPDHASELMATYMYNKVFSSFQLGYGSTIASAMFLIVALVAAAAMRATQRYSQKV